MSHDRLHRNTGLIAARSGAAAATLKLRAAAWDIPVTETAGRLSLTLWGCELVLCEQGDGLRLDLSGTEKRLVDTLRDTATELMAEAGLIVQWARVDAGALAPGLSLARVDSIRKVTPNFWRLRVAAPDAGRFGQGSLHFRLLIPPAGQIAEWPRVAETGRTVWPEGAASLHRVVYTVVNHAETWIEFDVFNHAGSPTCDWIASDPTGRMVGLLGPGGGWCPEAQRLILFGDETSLPAIARMLTLARGEVRAAVRAAPDDLALLEGDSRVHRCDDLLDALMADPEAARPADGTHVWFAGRADQARAARAYLLGQGWSKANILCAAYWD